MMSSKAITISQQSLLPSEAKIFFIFYYANVKIMIQLADLVEQLNQTDQTSSIELTAVIDTALCVGAGGSSGSLADKPIIKNADGRLIIPASQLKGRLRHECEKLTRALQWGTCESPIAQTMCPQRAGLSDIFIRDEYLVGNTNTRDPKNYHCLICQLFGNPSLPSRIQVSDLVCEEAPENIPEVLRPGVTINRRRGTAEEKKLYFLETSPANVALKFTGSIQLNPPWPCPQDSNQDFVRADFAKALLFTGLKHIYALGGSKSAGLGWLHWESPDLVSPDIDDTVWDFLGRGNAINSSSQSNTNLDTSGPQPRGEL